MSAAPRPKPRRLHDGVSGHWREDGLFELDQWMIYDIGRKNSGLTIWVPGGYATDFASIPWLLRKTILRGGSYDIPAVIHDWLYNTHLTSKPIADAIFYEALLVIGTSGPLAWSMYQAVSAFGHSGYRNGPAELRRRAPNWAHRIFDTPALPGREKEALRKDGLS